MMPGISGMEVLEKLNEMGMPHNVVVITGYATVDLAVEAMKKGAYDFISKPFTPDQLRLVVNRAFEKRELEREAERLKQEREKSLRDIATEKSRIKTIINCMGDGVLVTNNQCLPVLINPVAQRIFGIKEEDILDKSLSNLISENELINMVKEVLQGSKKNIFSISKELSFSSQPGNIYRAHTAAVKDESDEIIGAVTVIQDITKMKELDRMKDEFVAMVSHELRAPVAAIEQHISVILEGMVGQLNEQQTKMLKRVKERTKGLLDLVKDLLDLSKIEAGLVVQYKEPLKLKDIIGKVIDILNPQAEAKNITLDFKEEEELPEIIADKSNMEEVFMNLVSNAIKYTNEGGKVEVILAKDGKYAKIEVADTGIGIPKDELPKIFEKFYRVKTEKTRAIVGTGLGLSIVKKIIEAHFGSITVKSEENKGTTFTILLPFRPEG